MAYIKLYAVAFGSAKVALPTVGYQLKNSNGTNNGSRITADIVEIGSGFYQANVSIPDGHVGGILWDTGEVTPRYVYIDISPASAEIDAMLTSAHGSGSWQQALGGIGMNVVTITLSEANGATKIPSASVEVRNNAGDTLLATALTNSEGQATFNLDNGTYKIYNSKLSSYSFINPQTLIVDGNTVAGYSGTPISVTAPTQSGACRLFIWARSTNGSLLTALAGSLRIVTLPYKYSGSSHTRDKVNLAKHADGFWYADVVYGATVYIEIPSLGINVIQTVPTQQHKDIGEWLT